MIHGALRDLTFAVLVLYNIIYFQTMNLYVGELGTFKAVKCLW